MPHRVAYIVSRFPHLPETFILREMIALEDLGWQVSLYPLIFQRQTVVHHEAQPWLPRAQNFPFFSWHVLCENLRALSKHPLRYLRTLGQTLWENRTSPKFFLRAIILWPKAVAMGAALQAEGVDFIHAHYATHPALTAWIIHRLTGLPYSVTVHAHDIFVCHAMLATKLQAARLVVAISAFNRRYLQDFLGEQACANIHVIHCGIEPERYAKPASLWHSGERFEILHIGSLQPYKGQSVLIQACALLRDMGIPFRCRIIGGGELQASLQSQITAHGLEAQVCLLGAQTQDQVAALLAEAHCYVQPSVITPSGKMEGIPVALMEALACGLPVIATEISGIPELVRHQETGLLVPPAAPQPLADALKWLYEHPAEARRYGQAGQALVLQEFNLRTNAARLSALFEQVFLSPAA
ncbi:MAG: glycosyltransferase family 4 protein [Anaerolineales bacterium]